MQYEFIPSWVAQNIELDETARQLRILKDSGENVLLFHTDYDPLFRTTLNELGLNDIEVDSAYDMMQGIDVKKYAPLSYEDINWPDGIEFLYTQHGIVGLLDNREYARIRLSHQGTLSSIEYLKNGQTTNICYYDDRGFKSSELICQDEKKHQIYYDNNGRWHFYENKIDGKVTISQTCDNLFSQKTYESIYEAEKDIINKRYKENLGNKKEGITVFALGWHDLYLDIISKYSKCICTLWRERYDITQDKLHDISQKAGLVLADSKENFSKIEKDIESNAELMLLPYDEHVPIGNSNRISELKIIYLFDRLQSDEINRQALFTILKYMNSDKNARLSILYRRSSEEYALESRIRNMVESLADIVAPKLISDNDELEDDGRKESLFKDVIEYKGYSFYSEIYTYFSDKRIIIDLSKNVQIDTHNFATRTGIPQINLGSSGYIKHKETGYILNDVTKLQEAICYYFNELENWNRTFVNCMNEVKSQGNKAYINKWKEIVDPLWTEK